MNTIGEDTATRATRDALLRAGRRLFAERGYDGVSVRDLTARAGANLGAITYHFGSKQALYERVVTGVLEELAARVVAAAETEGDPLDRLESAVQEYFDYFAENLDAPRLILQELARGVTPLPAAVAAMRSVHQALTRVIRAGQQTGRIRAGVAEIMAMSVVSQPMQLNFEREVLRAFAVDPMAPGVRERVAAVARAFVRAGLEKR